LTTLESLGYDEFFAQQLTALRANDREPGLTPARIVTEGQSTFGLGGCAAEIGELPGRARRDAGPFVRPVVGDWVAVLDAPPPARAQIQHVLERRTTLVRRAAGPRAEEQVVAVNGDVFFIVTSANRDLNERRLERYLAAVWNSGARPVVVLNKVDLVDDAAPLLGTIGQSALEVPVTAVSAATGTGLDALREHIGAGTTLGFIGSTGVGKSTIVNRLVGSEHQATADLRGDERGRHTTTGRQLIVLAEGGVLLDTPGMRELGLLEDAGGLDASFPDVAQLAQRCRFRDCVHEDEPGCAVTAGVAQGTLPAKRLEAYRKLVREIAAAARKHDPALAGRSKARWKVIHNAQRSRAKLDPKRGRD
jgi:ribosome biogenesis GTPase